MRETETATEVVIDNENAAVHVVRAERKREGCILVAGVPYHQAAVSRNDYAYNCCSARNCRRFRVQLLVGSDSMQHGLSLCDVHICKC